LRQSDNSENHVGYSCAAKLAALLDNPALTDSDWQSLDAIIAAWPTLTSGVKTIILQIVDQIKTVGS